MKKVLLLFCALCCQYIYAADLLISSLMANPKGTESPYEYVELLATKDIDFSETPYTLIFCNNGTILKPSGWMTGSTLTYAMELNKGSVSRGDVFYVGGDSTLLCGTSSEDISHLNWLKTVDYLMNPGDASIGLKRVKNIGLIGNGGPSVDGIAVFPMAANEINGSTLPSDCVFYGDKIGEAALFGYLLPDGSYLSDDSHFYKKSAKEGSILKFQGVYDYHKQEWMIERSIHEVKLNSSSDLYTEIKLVPSIYDLHVEEACNACLVWKSANRGGEFAVYRSRKSIDDIVGQIRDSFRGVTSNVFDSQLLSVVDTTSFCWDNKTDTAYYAVYDLTEGVVDTTVFTVEYNTLYNEPLIEKPSIQDTLYFKFGKGSILLENQDVFRETELWKVDTIADNAFCCTDIFRWATRNVSLMDTCGNRQNYDLHVYVTPQEMPYFVDCTQDTLLYLSMGQSALPIIDLIPNFYIDCDSSLVVISSNTDSLYEEGVHEVSFELEYNGVVVDACTSMVEVRIPPQMLLSCPSDTTIWTSIIDSVVYNVRYPLAQNGIVEKIGDFSDSIVFFNVPDSIRLSFVVADEWMKRSDTCAYWVYVKDSIEAPKIVCCHDTAIFQSSVLSVDYMPEMAASPDGKVVSLFQRDDVSRLLPGERIELKFVAKDTLTGTHYSDTCSYWLTVLADTVPMAPLDTLPLDTLPNDTLIPDSLIYYIPTIFCGRDTALVESVVLSADYTPNMATSPDGEVESLFRWGDGSRPRAGERIELKFVAKDTLTGTHYSDTCSYWLTVLADTVPLAPLDTLPNDTLIPDSLIYYIPTIFCGHDTALVESVVLSADYTPIMATSPDGEVESLFRWGDGSRPRAGERIELKFVAKDTLTGTHYSDTCSYWLTVLADTVPLAPLDTLPLDTLPNDTLILDSLIYYIPTIFCGRDTALVESVVLSEDYTPNMAISPDGEVESLFRWGDGSRPRAGERIELKFVAKDTLTGTHYSDTCSYWLTVLADTIPLAPLDTLPNDTLIPDSLNYYIPTIFCGHDTALVESVVLSADYTPNMATSPDGEVESLFRWEDGSRPHAGERIELKFVAKDTLTGTHYSDTCSYWLTVLADTVPLAPLDTLPNDTLIPDSLIYYIPTIFCGHDTALVESVVLSVDYTPIQATSPDGEVESLFRWGDGSRPRAGERIELKFVAKDTLTGTHYSDTCSYWLTVLADTIPLAPLDTLPLDTLPNDTLIPDSLNYYIPTIFCGRDTALVESVVLSADYTPNMATSPDGEVENLFRWEDGSRPRTGERVELKFVAKDTLTGTHYSDTCSYWLTVLADTVPLAPLDTLPNDTLIPDNLNYYIPTIFCGHDTALVESVVLSVDYTPIQATSPDGEVESLFRWGDGSRPRAGERIELKFVAKDTLTGTHYSDTCSYWLTVLADTIPLAPLDTLPLDTLPNDTLILDSLIYYIPTIFCGRDTALVESVVLSVDYTPIMATSPDGEVENLFRWEDGSRPRAGERIELKFVAKDTLTGTHYSDTCSYWLTVLADTVPLAPLDTLPLDTLPNDTLIPDSLIYYIPTIFCGHDTALVESVVLSVDYTPNMATSPDGEVESLFRWEDGSRPRAGERIELKFVAKDTLTGTHYSDTCSYWLTVLADTVPLAPLDTLPLDTLPNDTLIPDSLIYYIPTIFCGHDTALVESVVLSADYTPIMATSPDGEVESLFRWEDGSRPRAGERIELKFVAKDTLTGTHYSDTCSYWLTVLADTIPLAPLDTLPLDTLPNDTHILDSLIYYIPTIFCGRDTALVESVVLSVDYTPNMATSPDGEVESLFRWGDGSRPRAGERVELKFVAKDTLTGTHYSDTCSYWLTVLADTVPLAPLDTLPLDTLPNDTLIPDSLNYYIPTIFCGHDTALVESVVLSADYTPNMATSPDGEVESLFRWGDGSRPRAGERIELKFVAKDTLTGTHYSDTCSYWLIVLADTVPLAPLDTLPLDTLPNDTLIPDSLIYYIPTIFCGHDTALVESVVLSADYTPIMATSPDGEVESLFRWEDGSRPRAGERIELKFVAKDTLTGTHYSDTCSYWLTVLADTVPLAPLDTLPLDTLPNDTLIPDSLIYYIPTIFCGRDTALVESVVLSVDYTPNMATSPDGEVESLFRWEDGSRPHAGERIELKFVAKDTLTGTHYSDTCSYWLTVLADTILLVPLDTLPNDTLTPDSLNYYIPTIFCGRDTALLESVVLSEDYTPNMATSPDGEVESLFRWGDGSRPRAGERVELKFVAKDTLTGTHYSDTCSYWLTVLADTVPLAPLDTLPLDTLPIDTLIPDSLNYYIPTIFCGHDTALVESVVLSVDYTPNMATSPDGEVESLFRWGDGSRPRAGERVELKFVAKDTLTGTHYSDTCSYWLTVLADTVPLAPLDTLPLDTLPNDTLIPDSLNYYIPTIFCGRDTALVESVVLSADYTPNMATSPDGEVESLFRWGDGSRPRAGERVELKFVAKDTLTGTHYSDTCSYWLTVLADTVPMPPLDTLPLDTLPNDTLIPDSLIYYIPTIFCGRDTALVESVVLSADYTPIMATSPDGEVESLFRWEDGSRPRAGERIELKFVAKDTLTGTHYSDTCSYWLTVLADTSEMIPVDTIPTDTIPLLTPNDSIYQDIEPGILDYIPEMECIPDTTITLSLLLDDFTPRVPYSFNGLVEPLFLLADVYEMKAGDRMRLSFVARDTIDGRNISDTCSYWLYVLADSVNEKKGELICPNDTVIYLAEGECEMNYYALAPICTNRDWEVSLVDGMDGAMMRPNDMQVYSFVAQKDGTKMATCSYQVYVKDSTNAFFKECSENLNFMAMSDTSTLNIVLDLPLTDKPCRWDTILMNVEWNSVEMSVDTIPIRTSPAWRTISLLPGEYWINWQLVHRGLIVDACESSVRIGVRKMAETRIKDVQLHNYLLTPNGDGRNDLLVLEDLSDYPQNELVIYNQWGSVVYRKRDYDNTWNGFNESSRSIHNGLLPVGTYFYVLFSKNKKVYSGFIELLY